MKANLDPKIYLIKTRESIINGIIVDVSSIQNLYTLTDWIKSPKEPFPIKGFKFDQRNLVIQVRSHAEFSLSVRWPPNSTKYAIHGRALFAVWWTWPLRRNHGSGIMETGHTSLQSCFAFPRFHWRYAYECNEKIRFGIR